MSRIIVFGATGAMGMPLLRILAEDPNNEIYATSRQRRESGRIRWLQGNAQSLDWLKEILSAQRFDAVVDFMNYSTAQFRERYPFLLSHAGHYVFLSSARVYAQTDDIITEDAPRILDVCRDAEYLAGDSYDLAKARQEDLLRDSGYGNYTVIRPSLTYNDDRLQLTLFEKDEWLYRPLDGNSILFPREMEPIRATMTHGEDVARTLSKLLGNPEAFGKTFNVNNGGDLTWGEILQVYKKALENQLQRPVKVSLVEGAEQIAATLNRRFQYKYARGISRRFCNDRVEAVAGHVPCRSIEEGLTQCVHNFFAHGAVIRSPSPRKAAYLDSLAGGFTKLNRFPTAKQKTLYLLCRLGLY